MGIHERQPGSRFSLEANVMNPRSMGPGRFVPAVVSWCSIRRAGACNAHAAGIELPSRQPDRCQQNNKRPCSQRAARTICPQLLNFNCKS